MSLSIVIPSYNPETLFFSAIRELLESHPDWQVIIVDDASDRDLREFLPATANLTVLRNAQQQGAGASRNTGIREIRGDYTVFMDDDDFIDWRVIEELMAQMQAQPAIDMAVSSYRFLRDGKIQPGHSDDMQILNSILQGQSSRVVGIDGNEALLRLKNYPWTKLYRTDFIRRIGLRFSETTVQNDIYAHWQSLLLATRIMVTNRVQCTQTVNQQGNRISNTTDHRRVQAFTAFRETYELVRSRELPRVEAVFWVFYSEVIRWLISISSEATRPLLMREHVSFAGMLPPDMNRIEAETGVKRWEIWNMSQIANMVPATRVEAVPSLDAAQWEICLTEISRLKRLATELRADNDRLRQDLHLRNTELEQVRQECKQRNTELEHVRQECKQRDERIGILDREISELHRHVNSKAAQVAFRLRKVYRVFVPMQSTLR